MGSVAAEELNLDLRSSFVPKTITDFLRHLSANNNHPATLRDFLSRLEDELRKIHAFKRELPLSMLLLNDGAFRVPHFLLLVSYSCIRVYIFFIICPDKTKH